MLRRAEVGAATVAVAAPNATNPYMFCAAGAKHVPKQIETIDLARSISLFCSFLYCIFIQFYIVLTSGAERRWFKQIPKTFITVRSSASLN